MIDVNFFGISIKHFFTIQNVKNEDETKGREDEYHLVKLLLIAGLGIIKSMIKF